MNTYADNCIVAAGATVKLSNVNMSTGGVLGPVNNEIISSDSDVEQIGEDFVMFTRPGGPGVIVQINDSNRERITELLYKYKSDNISNVIKYVEDLERLKAACYILVTDGCGKLNNGLIITKDSQGIKFSCHKLWFVLL